MQFSAMTMNMFFPNTDDPGDDNRIIDMAVEQSIWLAELGYHVWFTDHHFRGPWHSNPMQFAAYVAPLIPRDRYLGFGVLSIPFYHPVRLVESMNLLDQLTKGKVLFGVGSGWQGTEPAGLGIDPEIPRLGPPRRGDARRHGAAVGLQVRRSRIQLFGRLQQRPDQAARHAVAVLHAASDDHSRCHPRGRHRSARRRRAGRSLSASSAPTCATQMQLYRSALEEADHPQHVKDNCLRWCSYDWVGVTVAGTDEEAQAREELARAETMAIRGSFAKRHGRLDGPVIKTAPGATAPDAYAKGGDMKATIAGCPDTIAAKVKQLSEMGINHLHLRFLGEIDGETSHICKNSAELFAKEVMPRFAQAQPSSQPVLSAALSGA